MRAPTPLYARTDLALRGLGLDATASPEIETFRIVDAEIATVVVVLSASDAVGCYTVLPVLVPAERLTELQLLVGRANTSLHTSALELDEQDATLSARSAVPCGRLDDVPDAVFAAMVQDAIIESRRALAVHLDCVLAVLEGEAAGPALALRLQD